MIVQRAREWIIEVILGLLLSLRKEEGESFSITERDMEKISVIAKENNVSFSEALNRCLRVGIFIDKAYKDGGTVTFENEKGREKKLRVFADKKNPKIIHFKERRRERETKKES